MSVNKPGGTDKPRECKRAHGTVRGTSSYAASSNLHHREIKSDKWCLCSVTVQRTCALSPSHLTCIHSATALDTRVTCYQITKKYSPWNCVYNQCNHTGCPRRNVPDFGTVFLMLKYTDITQNTYVQSWTVTEIMAREKCGLLTGPRTVSVSWQVLSMFILECGVRLRKVSSH